MSLQLISVRGQDLASRPEAQAFYMPRNDGNFSAQVGDYFIITFEYNAPYRVIQVPRPMIFTWMMNEISHYKTQTCLGRFFTGPCQLGKFDQSYKHCPDLVWAGDWQWSNDEWQALASMVCHLISWRTNDSEEFDVAPEQLTCDGSHMLTNGALTNPDLKVIPIWIRDDTGVDKPYFFADLTEEKQPGVVISIRGNETWVATVQDWIGTAQEEMAWPEDFDSDGYSAVVLKKEFPAGSSFHKITKGDPCWTLLYWPWKQFKPVNLANPAVTTLDEVMMWAEHQQPYPRPCNLHYMTQPAILRKTRLKGAHWANYYEDCERTRKYV